MALPEREYLAEQLAETYAGGRVADPWQQVQHYRAYLDYTANNPDAGRTKIGNNLEIPPGRVRAWNNGSKPDAVAAIEVAEEHGWLDCDPESEIGRGLTVLVAWVFAGGSITEETWVPYFTIDETTEPQTRKALNAVGYDDITVRRADADNRATEVTPSTNASILGRFLSVLGAPTGMKASQTGLRLPDWLFDAPRSLRQLFARTYIWHRGTLREDRPNTPIQIREERTDQYRHQLERFLNTVVPSATTGSSETFRLRQQAASELYQPPQICDR